MTTRVALVLLILSRVGADPCGGRPFSSLPPYTKLLTHNEASACMLGIPANQSWITSTLDTLRSGLENFAFLQKMKDSGPPYNIRTDFLAELDALRRQNYSTDIDFQEDVGDLLTMMHDAHTQYIKPTCYHASFVMPFALHVVLEDGQQRVFVESTTYEREYETFFNVSLQPFYDRELVAIDGLEVLTAIGNFAEDRESISNDLGAAFNSAIHDVMYRIQLVYSRPHGSTVKLSFGEPNKTEGAIETVEFPWLVFGDDNLGKAEACRALPPSMLKAPRLPAGESFYPEPCSTWANKEFCRFALTVPSPVGQLGASGSGVIQKSVVLPDGRPSTISCFKQANPDGQTALIIKIRSFEPAGPLETFMDDAITCLQAQWDFVLLDVMQNGGGTVELAYRLAQLLIEEYWNDPDKALYPYDIMHSPLMDLYVARTGVATPSPDSGDPDEGGFMVDYATRQRFHGSEWYSPPVQRIRGGVLGNYSRLFTFNISALANYRRLEKPYKFPKPSELMLLTDGTCGSTCATFSLILNEQRLATTAGVGGISQYTMAVSSFAGGAVSNMREVARIGELAGQHVPMMETNAQWQFTWFEVYSKIYTGEPAQFVMQPPTLRIPWWDFPTPNVPTQRLKERLGSLYDRAIATMSSLNGHVAPVII